MIRFSKMHGLGNDFVVIDGVNQKFKPTAKLIKQMGDRHTGIGFDQLLLLEKTDLPEVDFNYRIFNADGSEVAQCGNGARCIALYIREMKLKSGNYFVVATKNQKIELTLHDELVTVTMGVPSFLPKNIPFLVPEQADAYEVEFDDASIEFTVVSIGNPHAVIRVEDLALVQVDIIGGAFQEFEQFPEQVNVGFMQIENNQHILLRVFERGVGETLACGSGACAAVVVGIKHGWLQGKVQVDMPGGSLWVHWLGAGEQVELTGPATFVYHGEWLA